MKSRRQSLFQIASLQEQAHTLRAQGLRLEQAAALLQAELAPVESAHLELVRRAAWFGNMAAQAQDIAAHHARTKAENAP